MDQKLDLIERQLQSLTNEVDGLGTGQVLWANPVEEAFSHAFRTNLRLDGIEDTQPQADG
jgi:hypothetical protein